jgi:hypothetical protein
MQPKAERPENKITRRILTTMHMDNWRELFPAKHNIASLESFELAEEKGGTRYTESRP